MPDIALIEQIQFAVDEAQKNRSWVILVVPDQSDVLKTFQTTAAGVFPPGTLRSSTTAILPAGGTVSVKGNTAPLPVVPFDVMFLGWGENVVSDISTLSQWRTKAYLELSPWNK